MVYEIDKNRTRQPGVSEFDFRGKYVQNPYKFYSLVTHMANRTFNAMNCQLDNDNKYAMNCQFAINNMQCIVHLSVNGNKYAMNCQLVNDNK